MVRGPAARRKAFVAETESLCFESEFWSSESNERNLFRVAGTSNAVVGNRSITMLDRAAATLVTAALSKLIA
ncbi:hypothetical protein [Agrobacterium pusense]|uniref:hypothetical protein n=1 Tax=Agrobacterium pusense TaxID=648995 RepID=UPI00233F628B|nr:hypothetical protein [Agrobacterium pusense]WCK26379.1 hypothetical protein CFBP5496_0019360 [Agrobacterium pusense]